MNPLIGEVGNRPLRIHRRTREIRHNPAIVKAKREPPVALTQPKSA